MDAPAPQTQLGYQPHVDALRAVAVLGVLVFHLGASWLPGGYVGVDVFFVISGYLITRLLFHELSGTGSLSFKQFYLRRVRRLLPALLVMLALTSLMAVSFMSPAKLESFGASLALAPVGLANFVFWQEAGYFDHAALTKPLLHTWSLGVEEQFYFIWPSLLLLLLLAGQKSSRRWIMPLGLALMGVASLAWNAWLIEFGAAEVEGANFDQGRGWQNVSASLFYLMPFRVYEFVIGGLLVWLPANRMSVWVNTLLSALGLGLVTFAMLTFDDSLWFPGYAALLPCLGSALLIFCAPQARWHWLLTNPVTIWFGLISYSLYLYHWPILVFWDYLQFEPLSTLDCFAIFGLSIVAAYLSFRFVEQPFRKPGSAVPRQQQTRVAAVVFSVLALAWLGNSLNLSGGWESRVAPLDTLATTNGGEAYPTQGRVGDTTRAANFFLVGDSHARHYLDGLNEHLLLPAGETMAVHSAYSCLHLPGITRKGGAGWSDQCPQAVAAVVAEVRERLAYGEGGVAPLPLVIMSHSWVSQIGRAEFVADTDRGRAVTNEDVVASVLEFARDIAPARLLVIGQVPTTRGFDPKDWLLRPSQWVSVERLSSSPARADYVEFNNQLAEVAERTEAFAFIDPYASLCEADRCRNLDTSGRPLYSDTSHLSMLGARHVVGAYLRNHPQAFALETPLAGH